jgi:hypothetical protein
MLSATPVHAILAYSIFQSFDSVVVSTSGALILPPYRGDQSTCPQSEYGALSPPSGQLYVCTEKRLPAYRIIGPTAFLGSAGFHADRASGIATILTANSRFFAIDRNYVSGDPIISSMTFYNKTLSDFGLTTLSGSIGSWKLLGTDDIINISVTAAPVSGPVPVPGPMTALGIGVAFKYSRRIRTRIKPLKTAPNF